MRFSVYSCRLVRIPLDNQIIPLPFGLLLKWSDGTRLEEVLATEVCRAAGLPTPKIISYGEHPNTPHAPLSILMTRLPGRELGQVYESLSPNAKTTGLTEFKLYLSTIRGWKSPWGDERVCSITGGAIRSIRVPNHTIGPCETPQEFNEYLLAPARNSFASEAIYQEKLRIARKLQLLQRPGVKFTHGDIKHHNILVDEEGHITGFLDWESAGWYPQFWEYTTALRFLPKGFWWCEFLMKAGAERYLEESECERALTNLTADSYSW
jgi:serine/threonine protein kinase